MISKILLKFNILCNVIKLIPTFSNISGLSGLLPYRKIFVQMVQLPENEFPKVSREQFLKYVFFS